MSFTQSVALALFDWHCSTTFRLPLIKQSMHRHGSLILRGRSDIDRLPNELLSSIFTFAIEQHCHDESNTLTISPTTISHICHRWRQVALETGSLWANIVLTFPTSNEQLTRALTWLSRSKTYRLDILLDFRDPDWDWEDEETHGFRWADMEAVLHLLLPCAARWRTIELLTDTWAPIFAFLLHTRNLGPSLKNLEKLHLARCNEYFARKGQVFEPSVLGQHLPLFGGEDAVVPRLRQVMLTGVHIDWSAPPLANLTKLELKYQAADVMPTIGHFTQILAASPNLEILAIVGRGPQFAAVEGVSSTAIHGGSAQADEGPLQGTIKLARVTQFTFGFVDVNYAVELLSLFNLPALCELSVEDVSASLQHQPSDDADVLLNWLASTAHDTSISPPVLDNAVDSTSASPWRLPLGQLHTLALHSIHAPRPSFARFYDACSELSTLRLYDVCDDALEALGGNQAELLPRMDTLIARGVDKEIFTRVVDGRGTSLKDTHLEEP
ncbi:hypothetical protein B0H19DRAFT_990553 [Mycena capillaripes]|nr:hypothetical protein B0H19DRAFT_990553 [Mycena capillaripes]